MALKVGELYVSLSARTSGFFKDLENAAKAVEKVSKEVTKTAKELAAFGAAAVALAATVDGPTKRAVDNLRAAVTSAAVEVARMLLPAIRELTSMARSLASWLAGLSPQLRQQAAHFAVIAVQVGVAAKVLGNLAGLVKTVSAVFGGLATAIGAIGLGPLLALVAALGIIVVAVGVVHRAWRQNWGGIQQTVEHVKTAVSAFFDGVGTWAGDAFNHAIDAVAGWVDSILSGVDTIQKVLGVDFMTKVLGIAGIGGGVSGLREGFKGLFSDMKSGAFIKTAIASAKAWGDNVIDYAKEGGQVFADAVKPLIDQVRGFLGARGTPVSSGVAASGPRPVISGALRITSASADQVSEIRRASRLEEQALARSQRDMRREGLTDSSGRINQTTAAQADPVMVSRIKSEFTSALGQIGDGGKALKEALKAIGKGVGAAALNALNGFGRIGSIVSDAIQAGMQGGPWAALASVIMNMVKDTEAFSRIVKTSNGALKIIIDILDQAFGGLAKTFMALQAVSTLALRPIIEALSGVFEFIDQLVRAVIPILMTVFMLFKAIAPLLGVLGGVLKVIMSVLGPVIWVIWQVVRGVILGVLGIFKGIYEIWNGIMEALAVVVDGIVSFFTAGAETAGGNFLRNLKANTSTLDNALAELSSTTYDTFDNANARADADAAAADAAQDNADAQSNAASAAQKVTESLLNVPQGFKVALARFNADGTGPNSAGSGSALAPGVSIPGFAQMPPLQLSVQTINVQAQNPQELIEGLMTQATTEAFRRTGNPYGRPYP